MPILSGVSSFLHCLHISQSSPDMALLPQGGVRGAVAARRSSPLLPFCVSALDSDVLIMRYSVNTLSHNMCANHGGVNLLSPLLANQIINSKITLSPQACIRGAVTDRQIFALALLCFRPRLFCPYHAVFGQKLYRQCVCKTYLGKLL